MNIGLMRVPEGLLRADADLNRKVDIDDFGIFAVSLGTEAPYTSGNFNKGGDVDLVDFGLLAGSFGRAFTAPASSSLVTPSPEPAVLTVLDLGALWPMLRRVQSEPHSQRCLSAK